MNTLETDDIIIRKQFSDLNSHYHPDDNRINFKKHFRDKVLDQKYLDMPIDYVYNSKGYRCNEFDTYEPGKFILVFGCSYTEGVGLHAEDVWHHKLGEDLGLPVVNMGVGGSGGDFQVFNTMQWIKNKYLKPKYVFYQWPSVSRKYFIHGDNEIYQALPAAWEDVEADWRGEKPEIKIPAKLDSRWYGRRYIAWPNMSHWEYYKNITLCDELWKGRGIRPIHWSWEDDTDNAHWRINNFIPINTAGVESSMARDMAHPGREIHAEVVRQLKENNDVQKIYRMARRAQS